MSVPVIKAKCETIEHPDGRRDVIVKVPMLKLIQKVGPERAKEMKRKLEGKKVSPPPSS